MDEYLKEGAAYDRLLREYKQHGGLVVGVDFDSTIHDYHKTGNSYEMVRQLVRDLKAINCTIIIWTAYKDLNYVAEFCEKHAIPFDGINVDGIPLPWESKKPFFNILIDDRAGIIQVYNDLTRLVKEIRTKEFYRVANEQTGQGLWYNSVGDFTGLIHNKFNFCKNTDLKMDFDPELVGWLSAAESLEDLYRWFSEEDIKKLQKFGWYIYKYETDNYKFYDRFQHYVIKKGDIKFLGKIEL